MTKLQVIVVLVIIIAVLVVILIETVEFRRFRVLKRDDDSSVNYVMSSARYVNRTKPSQTKQRVVVSLTSTPERVWKMRPALLSLLHQTHQADEIAVNLPYISSKGVHYELPDWLVSLSQSTQIAIHRNHEDVGPATKLIPTLKREASQTMIVVVDDDIIYNSHTVANLVKRYLELRELDGHEHAVTNFGVEVDSELHVPLSNWGRVTSFLKAEHRTDILQGFSGYLVTPRMFPPQVFDTFGRDYSEDEPPAFFVDDVWFSGWLGHAGVPIMQLRTLKQLPLPNYGEMYQLPSLSNTSPSAYEYDHATIQWFVKNTDFTVMAAARY